jgi:hypothetical protein
MSATLDDICAYAERKLAGTTLTFALVCWVKGEEADPKSVALSAPPAFQKAAHAALRTTVAAADPAGEPKRLTPDETREVLALMTQEREVLASSFCAQAERPETGWDLSTIEEPDMRIYIDRWDAVIAALQRATDGTEGR